MSVRRHSQDILGEVQTPGDAAERDLAGDAQWKLIQKNTFTRWTNEHLKTVNKHVVDLETDLSDGLRFIALVEVLSGKRFTKFNKRPTMRSHKLENVTLALEFLQKEEGIKIVNIDSSAIVDGKLKLILGLIWTLILHYSISMPMWEEEGDKAKKTEQTPKQRLLGWVLVKVTDVPVTNFTTDWNDGRAIGALVDGVAPGLCPDWDSWNPKDNVSNATEAMNAAEQWLDVPQLIKPAEMCNPKVDELSMMTYLSQFPNAKLKPGAPLRPKTNPARVRAYGPGLDAAGNSVGAPARFTVETFSAGRGELDIAVTNPNGVREQCEVIFNKDRNLTYSCHYTPTMEGQYSVVIKFANREIPKSPFMTKVEGMAGDPTKVTASGPGLEKTGVMVKKPTYFEVHTKNAGTGVVDVVIVDSHGHKDSTKAVITKKSNDLWFIEYNPVEDGLHTVNILFAGKPIPTSPFAVAISPAVDAKKCFITGRGVQPNGLRVGDVADFKVHTAGAGDGELKVQITGPGGAEEKPKIKKVDATTYECSYEPHRTGEYTINVTYGGDHVFKSPFMVDVAPQRPTKIKAYGPGLHGGVAGFPASFTVETNDETGGLGFSIEGPSQAKINCSDNHDGSALISYTPTEPGEYAIHILCDEEDIHMSPWMAIIKPKPSDPFDPAKVKAYGPGLKSTAAVNEPVEFVVDTKEGGNGKLFVEVLDDELKPVDTIVKDNKDGTYAVKFIPKKAVKHVVVATFGDVPINEFPYRIAVHEPSNPNKVKVYGNALNVPAKVGVLTEFSIDCSKAGPGDVGIILLDGKGKEVPFQIKDEPNNCFNVTFTPTHDGVHKAHVHFADKELPTSPFKIPVESSINPSKVKVNGDGIKPSGVLASLPVQFVVDASEAGPADIDVVIQDPDGHTVRPEIKKTATPGVYNVTYTPESVGEYVIPVKFNKEPVPNSPFKVKSLPVGNADKVKFVDEVQPVVAVGQPCTINLDPSNAGDGQVTCRINSTNDDDVNIDILDNGDGTMSIVYTPTKPGDYALEIKFGGKPVPDGKFVQKAVDPKDYKKYLEELEQNELSASKSRPLGSKRGPSGADDEYKPVEFSLPVGPVFSFVTAEIETPSGRKEKPTVVDNQDGTVGVVYTPSEEGLHKLFVLYNDKPINGSPFEFYVSSEHSGLVYAHGPGLSHGVSGEMCNFTIVTKDAGAGGLSLAVEGPSKADMQCSDNRDGTCSVSYLPTAPGDYKVNVSFDNKHIQGSPFTAKISPSEKDARKSHAALGGSSDVPLKLMETDLSSLKSTIKYPSGKVEPCTIKRLDDGQLGIGFTPTEVGDHFVEVLKHGKHVPNSPFKITVNESEIANASRVKAYGKGLQEGNANEINEFFVETKNAGFGGLSLSVEGPSKADMECMEESDGVCVVKYKPTEPGSYVIHVKFADQHIPGSPFLVKIAGQAGGVKSEEFFKNRGPGDVTHVGSECELALKIPAAKAYELEASVTSPSGKTEGCDVEEVGNDQFSIKFVPKELGAHTVSVKHKGMHLPGSPFQFTVGPIKEGGAHKVKAIGSGLERAQVDVPAHFNVHTREAGPGCLSVGMEGPSKAFIDFKDASDGSCLVSYTCDTPGDYQIFMKYNDQNIPDSPFKVYVAPSGSDKRLNIGDLQEKGCQLNRPAVFTVDMTDSKGSLDARIVAPSGAEDQAIVEQIDKNSCTVRFVPHENGVHQIFVRQNGFPIAGSPFKVVVGNVEADPSMVRVYGDGLTKGQTGQPAKFVVDTTKAGSGALAVTVDGPSKVQLNCIEVSNGYEFTYFPSAPGEYLISVKYGGTSHVPGSPYKAVVTGSGRPGTWNEQSKVVVETVTKSTTTQMYSAQDPRFDSDASKVNSKGMGLQKASANKEATFTVDASRAGQNMLLVGVMGPELPCEEVSIRYSGEGQYTIIYRPGERGEYVLVVKWGEQHIPGSPFKIVVQ